MMKLMWCSYPDGCIKMKIPGEKCSFCNMEQNVVFVAVLEVLYWWRFIVLEDFMKFQISSMEKNIILFCFRADGTKYWFVSELMAVILMFFRAIFCQWTFWWQNIVLMLFSEILIFFNIKKIAQAGTRTHDLAHVSPCPELVSWQENVDNVSSCFIIYIYWLAPSHARPKNMHERGLEPTTCRLFHYFSNTALGRGCWFCALC